MHYYNLLTEMNKTHLSLMLLCLLRAQEIRKVYPGGKQAVKSLSFGIPIGQCFGFLGINGAGKTTTLKMLSGEVLPSEGSASIAGFDILTQQMQLRRLLGCVLAAVC
jgi:ATP-binding cassette subfamily A (ABC1) protein 3